MADITNVLNLTVEKDGVTATHAKTVEGTIAGTGVFVHTQNNIDTGGETEIPFPAELGTPQVVSFELTTTDGTVDVKWATGETAATLTAANPVAMIPPPAGTTSVFLQAGTANDQKVKIVAAGA